MAKRNVHTVRGKIHWAKILGDPVPNYAGDNNEWTFDFTPDEESMALMKELGLGDRMKNKNDDRGDFMAFRQREKRRDGSFNRRISVVDAAGRPWNPEKKIGNESIVDVKFEVKDYGKGKHPGLYPQAVRVLELNEYVPQAFAPLPEDDPFYEPMNDLQKEEGRLPEGMEPELDDDFPE